MFPPEEIQPEPATAGPSRTGVGKMFDRIAHRYDFLNRLLSLGCDVVWRRRLARLVAERRPRRVLDLASGTGDQLLALQKQCGDVQLGLGIDVSRGMLAQGKRKIMQRDSGVPLGMVQGDILALPVCSGSVDVVTISFGIRNVLSPLDALREMYRVLRPGGQCLVLEFGLPSAAIVRGGYLFYFRHILPLIGGILSGDSSAYKYLNQTVETFPFDTAFAKLMGEAGFTAVTAHRQTMGIAYIYQGAKNLE